MWEFSSDAGEDSDHRMFVGFQPVPGYSNPHG